MSKPSRSPLPLAALLLVLAPLAGGCAKPRLLPGTKVPDTPVNRAVVGVVEKYRIAMERRDAAAILALVHPTYYDNSGTPEASDDLDFEGLKKLLVSRFKRTRKIRYRIEYQRVSYKGREAHVDTWIDATFVYDMPKANPRWRRVTDYNRFTLIKEGKDWLFIRGL